MNIRAFDQFRPRCSTPPGLQRKCACDGQAHGNGGCDWCRKRRGCTLQRHAPGLGREDAPGPVHEVLRSPGQPLDPATRTFMEPRFGHDFSRVRVQIDCQAAEAARAVNARAYTVGNNIVFGVSQYAPRSKDGQRLLAHELTHVVQQAGSTQSRPLVIEPIHSSSEAEADSVAERVLQGGQERPIDNQPLSISRTPMAVARTPIFGPDCSSEYDRCRVIEPLKAANQLLDRVLAELPPLASANVTQGRIVDLLNVHFHDPSNVAGRAAIALINFQAIKTELNSSIRFICQPPASDCTSPEGQSGAFTGDQPGDDISLCPTYFREACPEQARQLIHEMCHHIPATRIDHAYVHQPNYMSLTAAQAAENPDTYAQFSKMVFLGRPSCKECSAELQLRPGQY